MTRVVEGQLTAAGKRFAIVAARFNSFITEHLVSGAIDTLKRHGATQNDITLVHVPGSYEIPITCKRLTESSNFDAIIALGAVIRGATYHYELVCNEVSKGIAKVSLDSSVPITFGVITADTVEHAVERSGSKAGNKGVEAALAAIEMANVLGEIEKGDL